MSTKKLYDIDAYKTEFEARVISCEKVEAGNSCDFRTVSLFPGRRRTDAR